jgi:hypothetical protein
VSFLRRQIFPLFGASMTLAIGIALGTGPLQGDDSAGSSGDLAAENADLGDQVAALEASRQFGEAASAGLTPGLLQGRLDGSTVTLFVLPGVSDERVALMQTALGLSGSSTVVTVTLSNDLLDPGKKTYVGSVASGSLKGVDDIDSSLSTDPYEQIGSLIARAYLASGADTGVDDEATKIDSELQGAKLLSVEPELTRRGSLAIVLATGVHGDAASTQATQHISTAMIGALAGAADGTVVVTPTSGTSSGGLLAVLHDDGRTDGLQVSTLNVTDGSAAQAAAIFALTAAAADKAGNFGTDGSAVLLPPGMPTAP